MYVYKWASLSAVPALVASGWEHVGTWEANSGMQLLRKKGFPVPYQAKGYGMGYDMSTPIASKHYDTLILDDIGTVEVEKTPDLSLGSIEYAIQHYLSTSKSWSLFPEPLKFPEPPDPLEQQKKFDAFDEKVQQKIAAYESLIADVEPVDKYLIFHELLEKPKETEMPDELPLTLPQFPLAKRIDQFPPKGYAIYGKSGVGKSTAVSTWPLPMNVHCWDAEDKAYPYWRRVKELGGSIYPPLNKPPQEFDVSAKGDGSLIIPVRYGLDAKGRIIMQIEMYHDPIPEKPTAYIKWAARMTYFHKEAMRWATLVIDSTTQMQLCHRNRMEFVLHPDYKDPGLWFAATTSQMERDWTQRITAYGCNRVLILHIKRMIVQARQGSSPTPHKEEFEGQMIYKINAPGRLADADGIPSQYSELYRLYLGKDTDEHGNRQRLFQTKLQGNYNSHSSVDAPNPCVASYMNLWENF